MYYTGIGSRETPDEFLELFTKISKRMEELNYVLRSGGALGADTAFEAGVSTPQNKEIFVAWQNFRPNVKTDIYTYGEEYETAKKIAEELHPAWEKCKLGVRKLHTRNVYQILGRDLQTPSRVVFFYAKEKDGVVSGGTATAVKLARQRNIPTFNFFFEDQKEEVLKKLKLKE